MGSSVAARTLLTAAAIAYLVGCSHTYDLSHPVARDPRTPLRQDATAYIALPEDGRFETRVYEGSGRHTVDALSTAFGRRLSRVELASTVEAYERALESARAGGHTYLIFPEIKHWEDRATEWSGRPDKLEVRITVFDTASGELLDAIDIRATSRWGTLGGDHPQDLLSVPTEQFVAELFGGS